MAKLSLLAKERTCGTVGHNPLCFLPINTEVHIDDVSDAYILLADEALKPNGG
jgi:hypothetical protein